MALVVIPFTLCSLLLFNEMACERARAAQSPPPWRPGLPAILSSAYSFRLSGRASLRLDPAFRKRLGDLQPNQGIAVIFILI